MKLLFISATPRGPRSIHHKIDQAVKVSVDGTKKMEPMFEKLNGPEPVKKDHIPSRFTKRKIIRAVMDEILSEVVPHGQQKVAEWLLVKVKNKLGIEGIGFATEGPEEFKINRYLSPPEMAYKDEEGIIYKTKFRLTHGKPNRYMKAAHDNFGKNSRWLVPPYSAGDGGGTAEGQADLYKQLFARAGANRQGWATWFGYNPTSASLPVDSMFIYHYNGLASEGMMINEFARTATTSSFRNAINDNVFEEEYNLDLNICINSRYSTHTYWNSNRYSDANIKVYVCQMKNSDASNRPIWFDVAAFGNSTASLLDFRVPKESPISQTGATPTGGGVNWFDSDQTVTVKLPTDPVQQAINVHAETSSVLGMTPQQSMKFNENWEVLDVIDQTIGPMDKWELHLEQEYSKSHSLRSWISQFGTLDVGVSSSGAPRYSGSYGKNVKGDIVLLTVFSGSPASSCIYSSDGEDFDDAIAFPVDAAPCQIRHQVRHGMNVSWPSSIQPIDYTGSDDIKTEFINNVGQGWTTIKQKTNYTDRETFNYVNAELQIMSNKDVESGGRKTEAGT